MVAEKFDFNFKWYANKKALANLHLQVLDNQVGPPGLEPGTT